MNKKLPKIILIVLSLCLIFGVHWKISDWAKENRNLSMVINEVCSNSFSSAPMRWKESADWIELYNASDEAIRLADWTISDDEKEPDKFILPDFTIEPGAFQIIYATGEDYVTDNNIYLNFRLSAGENLYLYNNKGEMVDSVSLPSLKEDTSYSRITDAGIDWANAYPTPGETNANMQYVQTVSVESPHFSLEGGFYNGVQMLELSAPQDLDIYYTLDGSEPTSDSMFYTEPIVIENRTDEANVLAARTDISKMEWYQYAPDIPIDKITVVRAVAIDESGNKSNIITHSYVVDIQDKPTYDNLVTVSISTNPDGLFHEEYGIYVLGKEYFDTKDLSEEEQEDPIYTKRGRIYERPACIEIFDENGTVVLNQDVGIRVRGNATRHLSQKSFSVYTREKYSESEMFEADVFGDKREYNKLILMADRDVPKVRHELHAELLNDRAVDTQKFIRCNVFVDGEYWGVYSIAEVYNEKYIEDYYGIPEEEVLITEGVWPEELVALCANEGNLSEEELYEELVSRIDLESFIDYYASMLYIDNYDWLSYNGRVWKSTTVSTNNPYQDGKWRWMVYDTEWAEEYYDRNTFQEAMGDTWHTDPLVKVLMTSEEFRQRFVTVFMDLANTTFEKEHVLYKIDEVFSGYGHAMEAQGIRWGDDWADEVDLHLDGIREFFTKRYDYITGYLKDELELEGELVPVQLVNEDDSKGTIKVNTVVPELKSKSWVGYYYTDYPITLSVTEAEKNSFMGWYDKEGNLISEEREISVELSTENYYQAVFE